MSGLKFGDQASINIARRAAAVAGLLDHIERSQTYPVGTPCPECDGDGDCPCCGSGRCPDCGGSGLSGPEWRDRAHAVRALQSMDKARLATVCRLFEYQHTAPLGEPFQNQESEVAA